MKNATVQGEYIMKHLRTMQKKHPLMGDVRGKGLMIGVEFVRDGARPRRRRRATSWFSRRSSAACFFCRAARTACACLHP